MFVPGQVGDGVKLGGGKTVGLVLSLVLVLGLGLDLDLEEVRQSVHADMLIALAPADWNSVSDIQFHNGVRQHGGRCWDWTSLSLSDPASVGHMDPGPATRTTFNTTSLHSSPFHSYSVYFILKQQTCRDVWHRQTMCQL